MPSDAKPAPSPLAKRFRGFLPVVVDVETGGFDWNNDRAAFQMALSAALETAPDDAARRRLLESLKAVLASGGAAGA